MVQVRCPNSVIGNFRSLEISSFLVSSITRWISQQLQLKIIKSFKFEIQVDGHHRSTPSDDENTSKFSKYNAESWFLENCKTF